MDCPMAAKDAAAGVEEADKVVCIWKNCSNKGRRAVSWTVGSKAPVATAAR